MAFMRNMRRRATRLYASSRRRLRKQKFRVTRKLSRMGLMSQERALSMAYGGRVARSRFGIKRRRSRRRYTKKPNIMLIAILLGGAYLFRMPIMAAYNKFILKKA